MLLDPSKEWLYIDSILFVGDLAKLPHTIVKPPGAGRTFYLLQIGPAAYPTLQIACDYQQQCGIAGKPPR
jgi:hypothetical protein